jgi:hypothetical protein
MPTNSPARRRIAPCNPRDPPSFSTAYLEPLLYAHAQSRRRQPRDQAKGACRARLHPWFGVPSFGNQLTDNDLLTDQQAGLFLARRRTNSYSWFGVPFCRGKTEPVSVVWGALSPALPRNPRLQAFVVWGSPYPWFEVPFFGNRLIPHDFPAFVVWGSHIRGLGCRFTLASVV